MVLRYGLKALVTLAWADDIGPQTVGTDWVNGRSPRWVRGGANSPIWLCRSAIGWANRFSTLAGSHSGLNRQIGAGGKGFQLAQFFV